jgi:hypothetical protein
MMFATRRSLNDACTGIGKQLGKVYESIQVILLWYNLFFLDCDKTHILSY